MYIPVKDEANLVRDSHTNAILNTDKVGLRRSRQARRAVESKEQKLQDLEQRVEMLSSVVQELEALLKRIGQ